MQPEPGTKRITAEEALGIAGRHSFRSQQAHGALRGTVTMLDQDGRLVFRKRPNLIVLRGRTFALELLFGNTIGSSGVTGGAVPYVSDNGRTIVCWGVGSGGAPASSPFTPDAPPPTGQYGVELANAIPFRLHDTSQSASGDPTQYIPSDEIANYGGAAPVPGGSATQFLYYQKAFDVPTPAWYFSEANNTVYKAVELSISVDDCRTSLGNTVNELCLYFARAGAADARGGSTWVNAEMFSRLTWATEYLSVGKALSIEYRIYS